LALVGELFEGIEKDESDAGAPPDLIRPVIALVALTAIVALMMGVYRNVAVIRGAVPARYFQSFTADPPAEWVERPARAYMNLLELPVLFYVSVPAHACDRQIRLRPGFAGMGFRRRPLCACLHPYRLQLRTVAIRCVPGGCRHAGCHVDEVCGAKPELAPGRHATGSQGIRNQRGDGLVRRRRRMATFMTIDTVVKYPATPIMSITPFSPNLATARR